jgi:hypothetical protein
MTDAAPQRKYKQGKTRTDIPRTEPVPEPKKIGRPSKYSEALVAEMVERLSNGEPLRQICRDQHMPAWSRVYEWSAKNKNLSDAIAQARALGQDAIAEDTLQIIDQLPHQIVDDKGVARYDSAYVQWAKNRVELRLKLLAKWNPKRYGDKVQVAGDAENPLNTVVSFAPFEAILKNIELNKQR